MKRELLKCSSESEVGEECCGGEGGMKVKGFRGEGVGALLLPPPAPRAAREGGG